MNDWDYFMYDFPSIGDTYIPAWSSGKGIGGLSASEEESEEEEEEESEAEEAEEAEEVLAEAEDSCVGIKSAQASTRKQ